MKPCPAYVLLALAWLPACSRSPADDALDLGAETTAARIEHMRAAIALLGARPEHQASEVEVQHILLAVAVGGAEEGGRSHGKAEALAAEVYARAAAGEEFDTLERNYSSDVHPGIHRMSARPAEGAGIIARGDMLPGVGDVAWRLEVGEIGVVPYDGDGSGPGTKSPRGYHVVKRLR